MTIRSQAERAAVSIEPVPLHVAQNLARSVIEVLNLHRPKDGYCLGCLEGGGDDGAMSWPCPTLRAIERGFGNTIMAENPL